MSSSTAVTGTPAAAIVRGGRAGRDDLDAGLGQAGGQLDQAGLVVDGDQRAADVLRCARRWLLGAVTVVTFLPVHRLADHAAHVVDQLVALRDLDPLGSDSSVSSSTHRARHLGRRSTPVSTPASTTNKVAPVTLHPVRERVTRAVHARERGQQGVVGVDRATAEAREEVRADQLDEAAQTTRSGRYAATRSVSAASQPAGGRTSTRSRRSAPPPAARSRPASRAVRAHRRPPRAP